MVFLFLLAWWEGVIDFPSPGGRCIGLLPLQYQKGGLRELSAWWGTSQGGWKEIPPAADIVTSIYLIGRSWDTSSGQTSSTILFYILFFRLPHMSNARLLNVKSWIWSSVPRVLLSFIFETLGIWNFVWNIQRLNKGISKMGTNVYIIGTNIGENLEHFSAISLHNLTGKQERCYDANL